MRVLLHVFIRVLVLKHVFFLHIDDALCTSSFKLVAIFYIRLCNSFFLKDFHLSSKYILVYCPHCKHIGAYITYMSWSTCGSALRGLWLSSATHQSYRGSYYTYIKGCETGWVLLWGQGGLVLMSGQHL